MDDLPILVKVEPEPVEGGKAIFTADADTVLERVPIERLKESLSTVCGGLAEALSGVRALGRFRLSEVTINVEVTASGGVNLVGTAQVGGSGSITLTFAEE